MSADDILREIKNMDNGERIKLLEQLYYLHYDNRPAKEVIEAEKRKSIWGTTMNKIGRRGKIWLAEIVGKNHPLRFVVGGFPDRTVTPNPAR